MTIEDNITEEVVEQVEVVEDKTPTIQDNAREKGWKPLEEYEGNPDEWVDAKEFLAREPLFKGMHKLSRENKKLKAMLDDVTKMLENSNKTSYERAMKELKAQYEAAATEGNISKAIETRDAMKALETQESTPIIDSKNPAQEVYETWVEQNSWFETDPVLKRYANGLGTELAKELAETKYRGELNKLTPDDLKDIYSNVTKQVKEEFPQKFMNPNRKKTSVTESTKRTVDTTQIKSGKQFNINDLPDDETIKVARRLIKNKVFKSEEAYIKAYREGGGKFKGEA